MPSPHRSPRIEKLASAAQKEVGSGSQLPSPSLSHSIVDAQRGPRKRRNSDSLASDEGGRHPKRRQIAQEATKSSTPLSCPIAYWVENGFQWPKFYHLACSRMSLPQSDKRKSSSSHYSERQQRLKENGIYLKTSTQLQQKSQDLCDRLLEGDLSPDQFPCYPIEKVPDVLDRIQTLSEARLQRDVTPWVVPSAENLVFSGKLTHEYIGEEVNAEWIRCETMGGPRPKPDFCVGLQRSAFNKAEWAKLDNCATSSNTFYCTPNLWFPFLVCEVKTGRVGLDLANMQNMHSGSIAVRSVLRVCIAAYGRHDQRVKDLLGRILVFTVSHNNQQASIYGHYAVAKGDGSDQDEDFDYHRHVIDMFSLERSGPQRYKTYNFVRNVYNKFAPEHRDRLRDAIGALANPEPRTGLSFSASELAVNDEALSQSGEMQQEAIFKTPSEPASAAAWRENGKLREQLREIKERLEQQRTEHKEDKERMERLMERQMEQLMTLVSGAHEAKRTS